MDKRKIILPKEELYQKYIVENLTDRDCVKFFGVSRTVIFRNLKAYGIKKDRSKIAENIYSSLKDKYPEIMEKAKKTMVERYGVEYTAQSKELQKKMSETMMRKYGKSNYVETNSFKAKSSETCQEKYGVVWPCQVDKCRKALEEAIGHSKPEQEFAWLLNERGIEFEQEYPIRGFKYDFKVGDMLFEINPSGTHNANFGLFGHEPKPKNYHFVKHSVAKEFGFHCVHVFDWDDKEKIVKVFLENKERVFARKCEIKEVSKEDAAKYLNENHLQGYANDKVRVGLYYLGELVEIMTFDKPRYNKNYEWELVRLCSSKNVVGGAEKIFKYFVDTYHPKNVLSYCDLAKFDGKVYYELGFHAVNKPKPSVHWSNLKTNQHITDNLLRQKGFDQLFRTSYGKGTSNEQLMLENGFVQVYDCGQLALAWLS